MIQFIGSGSTIELIHFISGVMAPPSETDLEGPPTKQWRIACMPNMTEFHETPYHPHYQRTDDIRAVTCPACKNSLAFKEIKETSEKILKRGSNV